MREIDIHQLLQKKYFRFEQIFDRLWDRFCEIVDSFSYFGVKFRSVWDKKAHKSRIDWFDDNRWWGDVPFEVEVQIKDWMYITWEQARDLVSQNYREKS